MALIDDIDRLGRCVEPARVVDRPVNGYADMMKSSYEEMFRR